MKTEILGAIILFLLFISSPMKEKDQLKNILDYLVQVFFTEEF